MQAKVYVERLNEACNYVKSRISARPDIGIILGSGLGSYGDVLTDPIKIPYKEIPQMLDTTVPGHSGCLIFGGIGDRKVLCLSGRSHQYEGLYPHEVQFAIRLLALCGCKLCILTNAAGTRDPDLNVGDLAAMEDHCNFTHRGYTEEPLAFKPFQHIIQVNMYDEDATKVAKQVAEEMKLQTKGCVYCYNFGPTYETHAEVEGEYKFGVTNYGMSTVPEIIAMKDLGVPVFAMSFVTNKAAGVGGAVLSHEEVTIAAKAGEPNMRALISEVIKRTPLKDFPIPEIQGDSHVISRSLPASFVTDEEISNVAKQFGETKIDCIVVLGACHSLNEKFQVSETIDCNNLPHFPIMQHTSMKLKLGTFDDHTIAVFDGFLNLNGPEEHALYYITKLAKALGASAYIQTFSSGKFGSQSGISVVEDLILLFERPLRTPNLCTKPLNVSLLPNLNHTILASYHGPEFPSVHESRGLEKCGATHISLGSVKGPLLANAANIETVVALTDGAYKAVLDQSDSLDKILENCRNASPAINDAISKVVSSLPKNGGKVGKFITSNIKALQWNDCVPEEQNEQEDPETVNEIQEQLPADIQFTLMFGGECKFYNHLKSTVSTPLNIKVTHKMKNPEKLIVHSGELFGKKVLLALNSRELIRALAQKHIKIIAIGPVLLVNDKFANEKYVAIKDHLNVSGKVPLVGRNKFGERFPDVGHLYQPIEGLQNAISFNLIDIKETTKAFGKSMRLFDADVSCDFGPAEAVITRHSGGTFSQIGVIVKCTCDEWIVEDSILQKVLQ